MNPSEMIKTLIELAGYSMEKALARTMAMIAEDQMGNRPGSNGEIQ